MNIHKDNIQVAWISGMPRSGTTWLSQIFASSPDVKLKFCPLFSYEFKNALNEKSSGDDWANLFWNVYNTESAFLDQDYHGKRQLTSANSINIARWLPQMFYFFFAYKALKSLNKRVLF